MQYEGHMAGGVVVLDDKADLPEGTRVRVVPIVSHEPVSEQPQTLADKFRNVIGKATSLPEDMAAQHDHYIHEFSTHSPIVRTGTELIEYYQREQLIGTRSDIVDSQAHARTLREAAERRARP
jgi:hypothetical protein